MGTLQKRHQSFQPCMVEAFELQDSSRHWGSFVVVATPTGQTRVLSTSTRSGCASTPLTVKEKTQYVQSSAKNWLQGWCSFAGLACWRRSAFSREVWRYSCLGMSVFGSWTWEIATQWNLETLVTPQTSCQARPFPFPKTAIPPALTYTWLCAVRRQESSRCPWGRRAPLSYGATGPRQGTFFFREGSPKGHCTFSLQCKP